MKHEPFKQFAAYLALAVTLAAPAVAMEAQKASSTAAATLNGQIEFVIRPYTGEQWNASMTIDGQRGPSDVELQLFWPTKRARRLCSDTASGKRKRLSGI